MAIKAIVALLGILAFVPYGIATEVGSPTLEVGKEVTVYKSPTCGCCAKWAEYLRDNGFQVTVVDRLDLSEIKAQYAISSKLQSCHTALVDGYVIEGHVPANDIWRLLEEKPDAVGLTAPGMPMMSPGMRSIEPQGYDVLLFGSEDRVSVYSSY